MKTAEKSDLLDFNQIEFPSEQKVRNDLFNMLNYLPHIEECDKISDEARKLWNKVGAMNVQFLLSDKLLLIDTSDEKITPVQKEIEYQEIYMYYG